MISKCAQRVNEELQNEVKVKKKEVLHEKETLYENAAFLSASRTRRVCIYSAFGNCRSRHCRTNEIRYREDRAAYRHQRRDERKRGRVHCPSPTDGSSSDYSGSKDEPGNGFDLICRLYECRRQDNDYGRHHFARRPGQSRDERSLGQWAGSNGSSQPFFLGLAQSYVHAHRRDGRRGKARFCRGKSIRKDQGN